MLNFTSELILFGGIAHLVFKITFIFTKKM